MSFLTTKGKALAKEPGQERQQMREKAIAFGNHIAELEEINEQLRQQVADLDRRAQLAEAQVEQLTKHHDNVRREWEEEREKLKRERDDHHNKWATTLANLRTSANILLDAMKENPEERYRPRPASLRAVEKAIATRNAMGNEAGPGDLPAFLGRQQDDEDTK